MSGRAYRARAASADRSRRYRESAPRDARINRRRGNTRPTAWETGEFVAIDGEGFSEGEEFRIEIESSGHVYTGKDHYYAYLSASDGSHIYTSSSRLRLCECLDFLFDIRERNAKAIIVAFGGSYDITQFCAFDLDIAQIKQLLRKTDDGRSLDIDLGGYQYRLEYRPRKCFTAKRWPEGARKYERDKRGDWKLTPHETIQVWDVWGFFQDSFIGVLKKWVPGDPDFEFISRMKGERSVFARSEIDEIARYNAAELRCLVKVMNKVRDALNDLGIKITRWDGAGSVAAAMMAKHKVRSHLASLPDDVFDAARVAYSGGHIEVCKLGYYSGKVHHYDVNSAYPNIFRRLPSLASGHWISSSHVDPPEGFTLVELRFEFEHDMPFYPLFFRCSNGSIIYPRRGRGWYWGPEFEAAKAYAQAFGARTFDVIRWHHFVGDGTRPFSWVEDIYYRRQQYIEEAKATGQVSGPEMIIKLGTNSLYGKCCQQVGARYDAKGELRLPPYFSLAWGGYVTAGCRAMLMFAAIEDPGAIIAFATDGLFSTRPLDLYCPPRKELGAWEYKTHDGITMVMPGVYWLHDGETVRHYSRGFDKQEMSDAEIVHRAWREKRDELPVSVTRLIGLGSACVSPDFWRMRGCFVESRRTLCLDGDNSKRYPVHLGSTSPSRGLVDTRPRDHLFGDNLDLDDLMSAPYPIAWIDGDIKLDELEGEMADEREASDAELA